VMFTIKPSNKKFSPQQWIAKFHLPAMAAGVKLDGKTLPADTAGSTGPGWSLDATGLTLTVNLPGGHVAHTLLITLDGSPKDAVGGR